MVYGTRGAPHREPSRRTVTGGHLHHPGKTPKCTLIGSYPPLSEERRKRMSYLCTVTTRCHARIPNQSRTNPEGTQGPAFETGTTHGKARTRQG
ncbi:MAG: hypothetical protein SPJ25_06610 [Prevotella sp.]|nr:hypothetical protein [Prevotella sp.]